MNDNNNNGNEKSGILQMSPVMISERQKKQIRKKKNKIRMMIVISILISLHKTNITLNGFKLVIPHKDGKKLMVIFVIVIVHTSITSQLNTR